MIKTIKLYKFRRILFINVGEYKFSKLRYAYGTVLIEKKMKKELQEHLDVVVKENKRKGRVE